MIRSITKTIRGFFALALILGLALVNTQFVSAAGEVVNSANSYQATYGQANAVNGVQIGGTGDDTISIRLFVPVGVLQMTTTTGLTFSGPNSGNELRFSGLRSAINTALATLEYTPAGTTDQTLSVTIIEDGYIYNPENQHVYKIVSSMGDWTVAQSGALTESFRTIPGYLATITDQNESNYVTEQLDQDGWIGASDQTTEGDWQWATGPEMGTSFWSGIYNGAVVPGQYANWEPGVEPNNSGEEDCAQMLVSSSGRWNDLNCGSILPHYIVEFGTPGNIPAVEYKNITLDVVPPTVNVSTCDELFALDDGITSDPYLAINLTADIDCGGRNETSLFADYMFSGTLNGNGHTIANLNLTNTVENENVGLFALVGAGTFSNLNLDAITVQGSEYVGSLVGQVNGPITVDNVHATNISITNSTYGSTGGLIGRLRGLEGTSSITNSSAKGSIVSLIDNDNTGGLIGFAGAEADTELIIERSFADVAISGGSGVDIGGLIGELESDDGSILLQNVYAWGSIMAPDSENVGGLLGRSDIAGDLVTPFILRNTYAMNTIQGGIDVGGLIGNVDEFGNVASTYVVENSFSMSTITVLDAESTSAEGRGGGLFGAMGYYGDTAMIVQSTNNFFDAARTGFASCNVLLAVPNCTAVNVGGAQPNYFINSTSVQPFASWNFSGIWVVHATTPPTFSASDDDQGTDGTGANPNSNGGALADTGLDTRMVSMIAIGCILTAGVAIGLRYKVVSQR